VVEYARARAHTHTHTHTQVFDYTWPIDNKDTAHNKDMAHKQH
jgi:hypothetical protein